MTSQWTTCQCAKLGPLEITFEGLMRRYAAWDDYSVFYANLAISDKMDTHLYQCRGCKKFYQLAVFGIPSTQIEVPFEVPEVLDKPAWRMCPFPNPFEAFRSQVWAWGLSLRETQG